MGFNFTPLLNPALLDKSLYTEFRYCIDTAILPISEGASAVSIWLPHLEKLKHVHPAYVERDLKKVQQDVKYVKYEEQYHTKDKEIEFTYLNSGHIPGGASILMKIDS